MLCCWYSILCCCFCCCVVAPISSNMISNCIAVCLMCVIICCIANIAAAGSEKLIPADHRFGAYDVHNGKVPTTVNWPKPPAAYSIDHFLEMAKRQRHIVIDTWRQDQTWMNPSMIVDPITTHGHKQGHSNHQHQHNRHQNGNTDDKNNQRHIMMIWREPRGKHVDYIGYNWIDRKTWKTIKNKDYIEITNPSFSWRSNLVGEDARIFCFQGELFIVYNIHAGHFKQLYYAKVHYNVAMDMAYVLHPTNHILYQNEVLIKHEKNWTPFEYCPDSKACVFIDGCLANSKPRDNHDLTNRGRTKFIGYDASNQSTLLFIYSIQPHRIVMLSPYNGSHVPEAYPIHGNVKVDHSKSSVVNSQTVFITDIEYDDDWHWGEMRGGSRAVVLDDDHFLAFFHSSGTMDGKKIITYVMGAYLFQRRPPFAITHLTKEPIMTELFVNETLGWAYKSVDYIQFPMGVVMDEDYIHVSYGRNDRDGWIVKLNRTSFIADLKPVRHNIIAVSDVDDHGRIVPNTYKVVKTYD